MAGSSGVSAWQPGGDSAWPWGPVTGFLPRGVRGPLCRPVQVAVGQVVWPVEGLLPGRLLKEDLPAA